MGHADEDEVPHLRVLRDGNRDSKRRQIDGAKLLYFGRAGMGHADKMDECAFLGNVRVVSAAHGAAEDRMASHGKPGHGRNARKRTHLMAALEQHGNKPAAHVAGAAG